MESINNLNQIESLKNNKIIGKPNLLNSSINFKGAGNVLYCENNVKLVNSIINFEGNNSLIYLSSTSNSQYPLILQIYSDSVVFFGKNNHMTQPVNINVQEHQNLIIGDDCNIGSGTNIRTSFAYPLFSSKSKKRINFPGSVIIGDHVWLGHLAYISSGAKLGSGSVVDNNTYVPPNFIGSSNCFFSGNPAILVQEDVFFTKDYLGAFKPEDSKNLLKYSSNVFIYNFLKDETLSLDAIDNTLKSLNIEESLEFIKKLFVLNKRKNRFTIK